MDEFEERISDLMHYAPPGGGVPFGPGDIAAASRRRRARARALTSAAAAVAVVGVGVGVTVAAGRGGPDGPAGPTAVRPAAGGAPTSPEGTAAGTNGAAGPDRATATAGGVGSQPPRLSEWTTVHAGDRVRMAEGYDVTFTATTMCETYGSAFTRQPGAGPITNCQNADDANHGSHLVPKLFSEIDGNQKVYVLTGQYVGPTTPALIQITVPGDPPAAATVVQVAGQDHWVGWYLVMPGSGPGASVVPEITAYDLAGDVLAWLGPGPGGAVSASP